MPSEETNAPLADSSPKTLPESVADMPLDVHVRLGKTSLLMKDIFKMTVGSVIELGQPAEEPAVLVANGRITARGRLVINKGHYGLKVIAKVTNDKSGR